MSLAPHVESVVFDNALTWTAHHATRNIDYNIPQQLILYFDAMFQRNVGQIRDDISGLSNKFSTLQTDFHQLNDNFSALDTDFTTFQDQFDGFQSSLHDEISTLGNNVKTSQHQLASELRSEMRDSFKSFQQQFQANLQIEMFTLDSKFSASLKQTQSTLHDEISSSETKLFNLDTKFSASHTQLQTTLCDEIASLNTKLQNVESKIDDKLNSLNTTFSTEIHSLETKLHDQINSVDAKFDDKFHTLNKKIDTMENRLDNNILTLETKVDSEINSLKTNLHDEVSKLSNQMTALESKLVGKICSLDMKIDKVETTINSKIDDLDTKINSVSCKVGVLNTKVTNIDSKVDKLETKVDENFTLLSERLDSVNKTMTNFIIQQTKFNDDTDKKILDINKYIQEHIKKILTIEKAVDVNAEQIQDYLKLVDVRKSEIRIEFTKSLNELSEQLDQKIAGLSQSLRSEMIDLVYKQLKDINLIRQRVTALEITEQSCTPSTDTCRPMPVNQLNPNVGLLSTGVESMPAGTPIVTNSATVSTSVVSCDYPNSIINPVNTPSSMGQSTNHRSFAGLIPNESNLNSNIACSPSVPHSNFNDISCQNIVSNNDEPQRTMPIFDGTGDLDTFFTKFEILVTACNWTEKETICALLNDCLRGKAESIILSFPSDSVLTYHDVKYKMYVWFGSMRDKYYYQKQLSEITRKPSESMQEFHCRVAILANKAYPLSPTEREKYGVKAIIKGCNLDSVQLVAVAKDWDGRTIDETVNWIMDLENRYHSYNLDKHQLNLRSMNVRDSYDRVSDRPSRGSRDNDRDLPANYGQKSYYMSQERDRDERTFSPSSSVNRRRNSRSHYYSRDQSPVNDFSRNRSESRDNHNPSACYISGDHNHFIKNCPNKWTELLSLWGIATSCYEQV